MQNELDAPLKASALPLNILFVGNERAQHRLALGQHQQLPATPGGFDEV